MTRNRLNPITRRRRKKQPARKPRKRDTPRMEVAKFDVAKADKRGPRPEVAKADVFKAARPRRRKGQR